MAKSFVADIRNKDTAAIVRAIVGLGSNLSMSTTAEGVETSEQLDALRTEGCTEAQGFLFGFPMPLTQHRPMSSRKRIGIA